MHLGTVEVAGVFDFESIQLVVLFQDLLIRQNLFVLALKQKANLTLVSIFLNTSDLFALEDLLYFCIAFAF